MNNFYWHIAYDEMSVSWSIMDSNDKIHGTFFEQEQAMRIKDAHNESIVRIQNREPS